MNLNANTDLNEDKAKDQLTICLVSRVPSKGQETGV